ncbi:tetrapyrrole biosynthesis, uroporphyrinogen III synthase [Russula ochroleuca]|jgi:uroporphyrinogen-III synthase|uniref:Tetrapyrrole biosynthesis, uroporphyrinogen III synthase n=1 Tax=Russula ochroleuca TaxID=152965 RepID=A0A9P5N5V3_9AGAM|nr:tetrapyrrole biosynthesis, uroporphyrinogen III synthase [Russula ochroleuca]
MAPRVLLLRTPATPPKSDRYEAALTRASFRPLSLPALETALENLESLSRIVRREDEEGTVNGVIVTSARAVDACANAGADIDWQTMRFYAVGPTTAAALLAQLSNPPQDVRGTDSGTAEQLARFIVHDATREEKLLYLTGDKNRETLSRIVREGLGEGVLKELRVYATHGVPDFESSLTRALQGETDDDEPWWIVFFAPSAAAHVMPALRKHFSMGAGEPSKKGSRRARLAAIGQTTAKYIREDAGLEVEVVADSPTPDSLVSSLLGAK